MYFLLKNTFDFFEDLFSKIAFFSTPGGSLPLHVGRGVQPKVA